MVEEKELKYMGNAIKYKITQIPNEEDNYGRPKTIRVGKQSDAEQVTDEITGVMRWTGGVFVDMQINTYVTDEEYENLDEDTMIEMAKKLKI